MKIPYSDSMYSRFEAALKALPTPGGNGYHPALLGVANLGIIAGIAPAELVRLLRLHTPAGSRTVPDREIQEAVDKAARECAQPGWSSRPKQAACDFNGAAFVAARLKEAAAIGEADITATSPVPLSGEPREHAGCLLRALYDPDDVVFIGQSKDPGEPGKTLRTRNEWIDLFASGATPGSHIIPNPLTGNCGQTKTGKPSYRSDACVARFKFALVEFDAMPREDQLRFWYAVDLPVAALIDSGGKSLHAWVVIDGISTADEWTVRVEDRLFGVYLNRIGADRSCRNESRLSRAPGRMRDETGRWQRILFLCPEGRAIHACS